jgi:hypothetical protein
MLVAWLMVSPAGVCAQVAFPSIEERVVGVRLDVVPLLEPAAAAGTRVDVGDIELFGIAGLRLSGVRAAGALRSFPVGVSLQQVSSPVGSHRRVTAHGGVMAGAWRVALRAGVETLALTGAPAESGVVTALVASAEIGATTLVADVESIAGSTGRATTVCAAAAGRVGRYGNVVTSLRYDGPAALAMGVALHVPLHAALSLLAGYDDGTETWRAGAVIGGGRWQVATGVFRHAVLGMSQGASVTVRW